jgi:type II secretory pathway component PulF
MLGLEDWSSEELISELKQRRVQVNLSTQEKISSKVLNNISSSNKKKDNPQLSWAKISIYTRRLFGLVALGFLIYGSVPILRNLFSTNQVSYFCCSILIVID